MVDMPVMPEKRVSIEYSLNETRHSFNPVVVSDDIALTKSQDDKFTTSREYLNESITAPSRQNFIINSALDVIKYYKELGLNNEIILQTSFKIIEECASQNRMNLVVSRTEQNELLFYTKKNQLFNNLLIDEDGDVSYLRMGKSKSEIKTDFFANDERLNYSKIVSLL